MKLVDYFNKSIWIKNSKAFIPGKYIITHTRNSKGNEDLCVSAEFFNDPYGTGTQCLRPSKKIVSHSVFPILPDDTWQLVID